MQCRCQLLTVISKLQKDYVVLRLGNVEVMQQGFNGLAEWSLVVFAIISHLSTVTLKSC